MRVYPVPSSVTLPRKRQFLTTFVVNDTVAIDAGGLAYGLTRRRQERIKHVVLSHTHLDHLAGLPMFLDFVYDGTGDCVTVHGTDKTLGCLQQDLFNNRLWPDFIAISKQVTPYLRVSAFQPGQTLTLGGLRVTPVAVNHVIECMGFIVEDDSAAVIFSSDTGPTDEIWRRAHDLPNLKAVFLEVTFPNAMTRLADIAKHLTPNLFARELRKMPAGVPVYAVHLHARERSRVVTELRDLELPNLHLARFGHEYTF